ncbi:MAG: hypothetical protein EOO89_31380 [Pedobacter sp.]|nr:MAG: hypothetical protein EOO89_31380 [Pedobacter sp.]
MIATPEPIRRNKQSIANIRSFLKMSLPFLNNRAHHQALRYLYLNTSFIQVKKSELLFTPEHPYSKTHILMLTSGLVNGYLSNATAEQNKVIWIGIKGSMFMCEESILENFNVTACEPSKFMIINGQQLEEGCKKYPILLVLFFNLLFPYAMKGFDSRTALHAQEQSANRLYFFSNTYPWLTKELKDKITQFEPIPVLIA